MDLQENRQVSEEKINNLLSIYDYLVFEISAKSGENVCKAFYSAICLLPIFEDFTGSTEEIIKQLELENTEKQNYFDHSNSYSNGVSLETAKAKHIEPSLNDSNQKEISLKISDSDGLKQYHVFQKRKNCKCWISINNSIFLLIKTLFKSIT